MDLEAQKEAFFAMIRQDPKNNDNRLVFADWAEEHGEDELAADLRGGSEKWLRDWANKFREHLDEKYARYDEEYPEEAPHSNLEWDRTPTYEQIMKAATNCLDGKSDRYGDYLCLNFDTPDFVWDDMGEFWRHYKVMMGRAPENKEDSHFIRCAC